MHGHVFPHSHAQNGIFEIGPTAQTDFCRPSYHLLASYLILIEKEIANFVLRRSRVSFPSQFRNRAPTPNPSAPAPCFDTIDDGRRIVDQLTRTKRLVGARGGYQLGNCQLRIRRELLRLEYRLAAPPQRVLKAYEGINRDLFSARDQEATIFFFKLRLISWRSGGISMPPRGLRKHCAPMG